MTCDARESLQCYRVNFNLVDFPDFFRIISNNKRSLSSTFRILLSRLIKDKRQ